MRFRHSIDLVNILVATEENIEELLNFNCSGRCYRKEITEDSLLSEIEKYSLDNGIFNHNFAKRYLDIDKVVDRFMFG